MSGLSTTGSISFGLALVAGSGIALYGWSAELWTAALTWPPMIAGGVAMTLAGTWIGRAAATTLRAT